MKDLHSCIDRLLDEVEEDVRACGRMCVAAPFRRRFCWWRESRCRGARPELLHAQLRFAHDDRWRRFASGGNQPGGCEVEC